MTTASLIIADALQKLGVYAPGEVISDADQSRGLQLLNDMIDQWLDDSIQLFSVSTVSAALANATQSYTIGNGAVISTPRPLRVAMGPAVATVTSGASTTNVNSVSELEWNSIFNAAGLSGASGLSGVPNTMFYNPAFPWGTIWVAPIPNGAMTLNFPGLYGVTGFALPSTNYNLSQGEQLALTTNLAKESAPYYGMPASPELMAEAQQTKTLLTLTNRLSRAMSRRNSQPQVPVAPRP